MSNFEDGSYGSLAGIALIGKVLAGRCQMRYTRAAVGKGSIPDGKTPKTMDCPPEYVMDAKIASVSNPIDGECQVTLQVRSDEVENGFYITGIVLYAEDPDEGEIPYTYLYLENEPEWIRPASSVVGKFATFDLIVAVGDVDTVSAIIDPEAIATVGLVEQKINDLLNFSDIIQAFYTVYTNVSHNTDETVMTPTDIIEALNKEWKGESSEDETAMTATDITEALNREWKGESSEDETALSATDIAETLK